MFIYEGRGESEGGRTRVSAQDYFSTFCRQLIRLIHERTDAGMVWPVDMRLRPGGSGGPICMSLEATLGHYQNYGQTWERAMLIKARPVAGDPALGRAFLDGIEPFIYRRYLDYTTVAALSEMKRRIDVRAGGRGVGAGFDVKRGRGGIREVEFVIQAMQLIHGGRRPELRTPTSLAALGRLECAGLIQPVEAAQLARAYRFWRRVEHALQARIGEQTHRLPTDYPAYLSAALNACDVEEGLRRHARNVSRIFHKHVSPLPREPTCDWLGESEALLSDVDPDKRKRIKAALERLNNVLARGLLPERSRGQINRFLDAAMPQWLDDANGITALEAFVDLVRTISGRATWLDLLATHRGARQWLIGVLAASRYLSDHIVRDPSWLEWPLASERGETDIDNICLRIEELTPVSRVGDTLATLGRLVDQARVHCALAIDAHRADPLQIGSWLSAVADAATRAALRLSLARIGLPPDFPLVALAMGKHGGREMGLVSDLDMVFILVHAHADTMIAGRSAREQAQRLGRRIIQILSASPPFGAGFDFDARLRPSGSGGILVTTLESFRDYQWTKAQTWEHQALCRARPVAGPPVAQASVAAVVQEVLAMPRDPRAVAVDVLRMRQKMLRHLASRRADRIDVKQDAGGLVDIEFLAQYARLAFGGDFTGCVETLRHLSPQAPPAWHRRRDCLCRTWIDYRQMENALRVELWRSIRHLPVDAGADEWRTIRRHTRIQSPQALQDLMRKTHACFLHLLGAREDEGPRTKNR